MCVLVFVNETVTITQGVVVLLLQEVLQQLIVMKLPNIVTISRTPESGECSFHHVFPVCSFTTLTPALIHAVALIRYNHRHIS